MAKAKEQKATPKTGVASKSSKHKLVNVVALVYMVKHELTIVPGNIVEVTQEQAKTWIAGGRARPATAADLSEKR